MVKGKKGQNRKSIYDEDVQGFALDLSLRGLESIKVVELALLPLVTTLDLSNNKIIAIPVRVAACIQMEGGGLVMQLTPH